VEKIAGELRLVPSTQPTRVRVSQLPDDMHMDEFLELAKNYGPVRIVEFSTVRELHKSVCKEGVVEYATPAEGKLAVNSLGNRRMVEWSMRLQAHTED